MNLITEEMTTEAAEMIERILRLLADTSAFVEDIKEFSWRCSDGGTPKGLSLQAQDEVDHWRNETLGVYQMYGLLDTVISTIVRHHDSGRFEPFSEAEIVERVSLAQAALSVLQSDDTAGHAPAVAN